MVGRPRSIEADRAILDAALVEYAERGLDGLSVDAVAARAGVSKATIYRRYPSKEELVIAAAYVACEESSFTPDTGSLRDDVRGLLQSLRNTLDDPILGAAKRRLVIDSNAHDELGRMHRELVKNRRERTFAMLRRAIERDELHADLDLEFAADQLGAQVFYRYLLMHEHVSDEYIDKVVDAFVARYGVEQTAST